MTTIKINQQSSNSRKVSSEYFGISDISKLDFNAEKIDEIKVNHKVKLGGQPRKNHQNLVGKSEANSISDKRKEGKKVNVSKEEENIGELSSRSILYQLKVDIEKAIGEKPVHRGQYKVLQEILKNNKVKQVRDFFCISCHIHVVS